MSKDETRSPTPEQIKVIEADEPSFTVIASAGAGKTYVLVERYLRHVEVEGISPDEILTITFTKKAAAEMKARIVERLREKGLTEQSQAAETGPIQTIHSFCERLLRENALEAGLDPGYTILSEPQAKRLNAESIREALASPMDEIIYGEDLIRLQAGKSGYGDASPYAEFESIIEGILKGLRSGPFSRDSIRAAYASADSLMAKWLDEVRAKLPAKAQPFFDQNEVGDLHERVQKSCKEAGVSTPTWAKGKGDSDADDQALRHSCALVQLACVAWSNLDREMSRQQALDFAALEIRTDRLLTDSEVTRQRLSEQYRVVMVDESQDVNPIQYRLLDRLGCHRSMMVGDAQQSIYGFRQADVELFRTRTAAPETKRLSKNWRSTPGILNFVDLVFGQFWGNDYSPMQSSPEVMDFDSDDRPIFDGVELWRQPPKSFASTAGYIRLLCDEGEIPGDIAVLVRDHRTADGIKIALDEVGIASRVVGGSEKFYTRLEIRDLANALQVLSDPYDDFAMLSTLRSPIVGLSMDTIALLGLKPPVIESLPEFKPPVDQDGSRISLFLKWFCPLREYADRLSAWEALSEIFARTNILPSLAQRRQGDQQLANVRKLFALAKEEPNLGPQQFAERIREIQDLRHREGDAPFDDNENELVKITTIHKAKGLEWPVVVVPQTDKKLTGRTPSTVVEPNIGLVATKFTKNASMMHMLLADRRKKRDEAEEMRVLYVALTRAKRRLCIVDVPASPVKTLSKLIRQAIDPERMPGLQIRTDFSPTPNSE